MKRFFPLLVIIVGLIVFAFVLRQCRQSGAANYQTATVTHGPLTQAVTAAGTLNPVVNVQVGSQVSGNIAKLFADFHSQVKAEDMFIIPMPAATSETPALAPRGIAL
jgi:HlyD family secretion protein